jgi:hypothetical protein
MEKVEQASRSHRLAPASLSILQSEGWGTGGYRKELSQLPECLALVNCGCEEIGRMTNDSSDTDADDGAHCCANPGRFSA